MAQRTFLLLAIVLTTILMAVLGALLLFGGVFIGGIWIKDTNQGDYPALLDGYVNPWYGSPNETYTFSVVYKDPRGQAPEYLQVAINGTRLNMEPFPGVSYDYIHGVPYIARTKLPIGNYSYFFEAKNHEEITRFPKEREHAFIVAFMEAYFANATVAPMVGGAGDTFTFSVTYVGEEGPHAVKFHAFPYRVATLDDFRSVIRNSMPKADPNATNYSDGVEYQVNVTLEEGVWWYYFWANHRFPNESFHYPYFRDPDGSLERGANEEFFPGPWVIGLDIGR
ncbi:MAG: hypothetical protein ACFFB3_23815 [Candidatus Hodarchaeota archaeon]